MVEDVGYGPINVNDEAFMKLLREQGMAMRKQMCGLPSIATLGAATPTSRFTKLEASIAPIEVNTAITRHMSVALNCLQRAASYLTKTYAEHALFMLLRGAVENAAICVWLLEGDDDELITKALINRTAELFDDHKTGKLFGAGDKSYRAPKGHIRLIDQQIDQVLKVAEKLGVAERKVVKIDNKTGQRFKKYNLSQILKTIGKVEGIETDIFSIWSMASGLAHGNQYLGLRELVVESVDNAPVGYHIVLAQGQAQTALHLYVAAQKKYEELRY